MAGEIHDEIRGFIVETFLFGQDDGLASDESLLERRILDSTGILEIASFLTERWAFTVQDEELLPDNFGTIEKLVAFVERRRAGGVP